MNDEDIERVLRATGPRARPPEEVERAVHEGLRNEWRSIVAVERTRRQRRAGFALAASFAVAAFGIWLARPLVTGPADAVATVALVSGEFRAKGGLLGRWQAVSDRQALNSGQVLMTGPGGRGAVNLPGGVSTRLDHDTRIRLAGADRVVIERGALYVDSGRDSAKSARLDVVTPTGTLRHLGTQYEVRLLGSDVRVRVREGRVEWNPGNGPTASGQVGEQLTIARNGAIAHENVPRYGPAWDWVAAATPGMDIDGRPLIEFLSWAGRELGHEIVFSTAEVEVEATTIVVHGSIAGLTPMQALDAVLATTRMHAIHDGGRIVIDAQDSGRQPGIPSKSANSAT